TRDAEDMLVVVYDRTHDDAILEVALVDAQRRVGDGALHLVRDVPRDRRELDRLFFVAGQFLRRADRREERIVRMLTIEVPDEERPHSVDGRLREVRCQDAVLTE